jgi:hypothetical protein
VVHCAGGLSKPVSCAVLLSLVLGSAGRSASSLTICDASGWPVGSPRTTSSFALTKTVLGMSSLVGVFGGTSVVWVGGVSGVRGGGVSVVGVRGGVSVVGVCGGMSGVRPGGGVSAVDGGVSVVGVRGGVSVVRGGVSTVEVRGGVSGVRPEGGVSAVGGGSAATGMLSLGIGLPSSSANATGDRTPEPSANVHCRVLSVATVATVS